MQWNLFAFIVIDRQRGRARAPTSPPPCSDHPECHIRGGLSEPRDGTHPGVQRLCSTQLWEMSLASRGPSQEGLAVQLELELLAL